MFDVQQFVLAIPALPANLHTPESRVALDVSCGNERMEAA
jgi:hypothetical protein